MISNVLLGTPTQSVFAYKTEEFQKKSCLPCLRSSPTMQLTLKDATPADTGAEISYPCRRESYLGYVEHDIPDEEPIYIPINLKIAIDVVNLCSKDIIDGKKTTPVQQIDRLARSRFGNNEFMLICAANTPKALIGKVADTLIAEPITIFDGTTVESKNFKTQPLSADTQETLYCKEVGQASYYDITQTKAPGPFSATVYQQNTKLHKIFTDLLTGSGEDRLCKENFIPFSS